MHNLDLAYKGRQILACVLPMQYYASGYYVSVCLSQVGVLTKRLDRSSWFLAWK